MEQNWKLYGMWVLLDALFALLIFSLAPLILGIQIAHGLLFYAQYLIYILAIILIISTFMAFHRGCMVNLRHSVLRTADVWWRWIVFHWGLGILVSFLSLLAMLVLGPVLNTNFRYLGLFIGAIVFAWLLHFIAIAQFCFLKKWSFLAAISEAWQKRSTSRFHGALYSLLMYEISLLAIFLFVEFIFRHILDADVYIMIDRFLVFLYFVIAIAILYLRSMKTRMTLFG